MAAHFREHIRSYNAAFSFTSFGAQLDPRASRSRGPYSFVICGENYHRIGSLLPLPGRKPKYSQLYIFYPETELIDRVSNFSSTEKQLRPDIVSGLMRLFDINNELVKSFRRIRTELSNFPTNSMKLRIVGAREPNRQYDLPTGTELAGLVPGDFVADKEDRDIIIDHRTEGLKRITSLNPRFDALHFPVLFPYGEDGFHTKIPYDTVHTSPTLKHWVEIPEALLIQTVGSPVQTMATEIYTDFQQRYHNISYLTERSIITPTNRNVTEINAHMLALVPGTGRSYYSSDTLHTDAADSYRIEAEYPTEFLNGLSFNGYPEHNIELKVFTPVMLLRNLNPAIGLCNGTRLMVIYLGHYVIRGIIMGGTFSGKTVAIPRIVLNINDHRWPFVLKRRQFPVRLCYAMTINKSQGQTLQSVGVYLPKPVFSHGQLYVAVSRVRSASGLRLLIINEDGIPSKYTRNIVYQEALADLLDIADVAQVCLVFHNFLF
ncbi:unnamed protein product [Linum tenue]|uniref:DNA helicase Pif1-like 2B domain-containing protein n=1 Tax=Linum tenue TaxID=586396 RepID=A0AAV0PYL1_9ROSI|nr:unnamed protein product [Linum tenue]